MAGRQYHDVMISGAPFSVDVRYQNLKQIGGGSYGIVCSADDSVENRRVAIKKVPNTFQDLVDAKRILREIKLLRHFDGHDNVIRIYDIMIFPHDQVDFNDIYIVTNLMESDLDRIIASEQQLSDQHFQYFLYQMLRGMRYVHSANVLHRDLKPSNLLVNSNCELAVCDFGLARGVEEDQAGGSAGDMTEYVVTRWYRAPELLSENRSYDDKVDVWAVGCIFAEMLRRGPYLKGDTPMQQLELIIKTLGMPTEEEMSFIENDYLKQQMRNLPSMRNTPLNEQFPKASPGSLDLLGRMLKFNPNQRISVDDALKHPYLAQLHNKDDEPACEMVFNNDFERECIETGRDIPKRDIQEMMIEEMRYFRPSKESLAKMSEDSNMVYDDRK